MPRAPIPSIHVLIRLNGTKITGDVESLSDLSNLTEVRLHDTHVHGNIWESFSTLAALTVSPPAANHSFKKPSDPRLVIVGGDGGRRRLSKPRGGGRSSQNRSPCLQHHTSLRSTLVSPKWPCMLSGVGVRFGGACACYAMSSPRHQRGVFCCG